MSCLPSSGGKLHQEAWQVLDWQPWLEVQAWPRGPPLGPAQPSLRSALLHAEGGAEWGLGEKLQAYFWKHGKR
jgi:hypothetical protein